MTDPQKIKIEFVDVCDECNGELDVDDRCAACEELDGEDFDDTDDDEDDDDDEDADGDFLES